MRKQQYDFYNDLIFKHDCVIGLIKKPFSGYPYNFTGLLHSADNVLIHCTEDYELKEGWKCREIAIKGINNKNLKPWER